MIILMIKKSKTYKTYDEPCPLALFREGELCDELSFNRGESCSLATAPPPCSLRNGESPDVEAPFN